MAHYTIGLRYTKALIYVSERNVSQKKEVTLKDSDGVLYRWDTCSSSNAYKIVKDILQGPLEFTYKGEMHNMELISHIRLKK